MDDNEVKLRLGELSSNNYLAGQQAIADASKASAMAIANSMAEARIEEARQRHAAEIAVSNNRLDEARERNATTQMAIMSNSKDFQFQILAWLTSQLESLDTKTQIAMKDASVRLVQIASDTSLEEKRLKIEEKELDIRKTELLRSQGVERDGIPV